MGQQNPDWFGHGAGQVSDAGVRGDHQIERGHQSCCFGKVAVAAGAIPDKDIAGQTGQLLRGPPFLQ